jgi:hypothetical protein
MTMQLFALSLGFAGLILATQAMAESPQCGPRDAVIARLAERYGETRRGLGIAGNDAVMEIFASDKTGSRTITVNLPNGTMFLVASGLAYEEMAEDLSARGEPA